MMRVRVALDILPRSSHSNDLRAALMADLSLEVHKMPALEFIAGTGTVLGTFPGAASSRPCALGHPTLISLRSAVTAA